MPVSANAPIAGVILAGGRSSRMRADKPLTPLAGRPLIAHVLSRLRPQVDFVIISANGDPARFAGMDALVAPDAVPEGFAGPMAGLSAAMRLAVRRGAVAIATAPCDSPFLPHDLVARLRRAREESGALASVARYAGQSEPLFGLWSVALRADIDAALARGEASPRRLLELRGAAVAAFEHNPQGNPFENVNDAEALAAAGRRLTERL